MDIALIASTPDGLNTAIDLGIQFFQGNPAIVPYTIVQFTTFGGAPSAGDVLTQATSGAAGIVVYVNAGLGNVNWLALVNVRVPFDLVHNVTDVSAGIAVLGTPIAQTFTLSSQSQAQIQAAIAAVANNPANGDLATDAGLKSAVIVSLFTDRLANADDQIPSGDGDRRGWWGDMPVGDTPEAPDLTGSRLWLLDRAAATVQNARLAEHYAEEALQWLIDDGIASAVTATAAWIAAGALSLTISIVRVQTTGNRNPIFDLIWSSTTVP